MQELTKFRKFEVQGNTVLNTITNRIFIVDKIDDIYIVIDENENIEFKSDNLVDLIEYLSEPYEPTMFDYVFEGII